MAGSRYLALLGLSEQADEAHPLLGTAPHFLLLLLLREGDAQTL